MIPSIPSFILHGIFLLFNYAAVTTPSSTSQYCSPEVYKNLGIAMDFEFGCELIAVSIKKEENNHTLSNAISSRIELQFTRYTNASVIVKLQETDGLLVNSNTPVWFRSNSSTDTDTSFCRDEKAIDNLGAFTAFHNHNAHAAFIVFHTKTEDVVDGVIGDGITIRYLPSLHQHALIIRDRSAFDDFLPNTVSILDDKTVSTNIQPHIDNASRETVYLKILIPLDYSYVESKSLTEILKSVVVYWNAVDMLFSSIKAPELPKIRLNIAGIIVPHKNKLYPYLPQNQDDKFNTMGPREVAQYFSEKDTFLSSDSYDAIVTMTKLPIYGGMWENGSDKLGTLRMIAITERCQISSNNIKNIKQFSGVIKHQYVYDTYDIAANSLGYIFFTKTSCVERFLTTHVIGLRLTRLSRADVRQFTEYFKSNKSANLRIYPKTLNGNFSKEALTCRDRSYRSVSMVMTTTTAKTLTTDDMMTTTSDLEMEEIASTPSPSVPTLLNSIIMPTTIADSSTNEGTSATLQSMMPTTPKSSLATPAGAPFSSTSILPASNISRTMTTDLEMEETNSTPFSSVPTLLTSIIMSTTTADSSTNEDTFEISQPMKPSTPKHSSITPAGAASSSTSRSSTDLEIEETSSTTSPSVPTMLTSIIMPTATADLSTKNVTPATPQPMKPANIEPSSTTPAGVNFSAASTSPDAITSRALSPDGKIEGTTLMPPGSIKPAAKTLPSTTPSSTTLSTSPRMLPTSTDSSINKVPSTTFQPLKPATTQPSLTTPAGANFSAASTSPDAITSRARSPDGKIEGTTLMPPGSIKPAAKTSSSTTPSTTMLSTSTRIPPVTADSSTNKVPSATVQPLTPATTKPISTTPTEATPTWTTPSSAPNSKPTLNSENVTLTVPPAQTNPDDLDLDSLPTIVMPPGQKQTNPDDLDLDSLPIIVIPPGQKQTNPDDLDLDSLPTIVMPSGQKQTNTDDDLDLDSFPTIVIPSRQK